MEAGTWKIMPMEGPTRRSRLAAPVKAGEWVLNVESTIDRTDCDLIIVGGQDYEAIGAGPDSRRIVISGIPFREDYPAGTEVIAAYSERL